MADTTIKFYLGNERVPVVEKRNFGDSIFRDEYQKGLRILSDYLHDKNDNALRVIAFCGDRGTGKTSCMSSFANLICNYSQNDTFIKGVLGEDNLVSKEKFLQLPLLDPSYFDSDYNLLEFVMGLLYNFLEQREEKSGDCYKYSHLFSLLERVKRGIFHLHSDKAEKFDKLSEIRSLSLSMNLRIEIRKLIQEILKEMKLSRLLLLIDDIDLNLTEAYNMAEHIRKYLNFPECIMLMATKEEQLQKAVELAIRAEALSGQISIPWEFNRPWNDSEFAEMAKRYIGKLLPYGSRVSINDVSTLVDSPIEVFDRDNKKIYANTSVKEAVVELIFQRTRYLFYNTKGGSSRIIPYNLRQLFQLLGLLVNLPEIGEAPEVHLSNKQVFKNYFYNVWTQRLSDSDRAKVQEWINLTPDRALNKTLCAYLADTGLKNVGVQVMREGSPSRHYVREGLLSRDYSTPFEYENGDGLNVETSTDSGIGSQILSSISDKENFSYNVSTGDLFYLINLFEKDDLSEEQANMLFFIKNHYSIRLYENYDLISEEGCSDYPEETSERGIYRSDERFSNTNPLQRLVNGSFFTFDPNSLIPNSGNAAFGNSAIRFILGNRKIGKENKGLNGLINEIIKLANDEGKRGSEEFIFKLNLAIFFILTVERNISAKQTSDLAKIDFILESMKKARKNALPVAYARFNQNTGYYVFNAMAPFANMVNLRYAFNRFFKGDELFLIALQFEDSLIWKMRLCSERDSDQEELKEKLKKAKELDADKRALEFFNIYKKYHRALLSDSIIRNAEVLAAMKEDAENRRNSIRPTGETDELRELDKLIIFYNSLHYGKENAMKTHRRVSGVESSSHAIKFNFIQVLADFLKEILPNKKEDGEDLNEKAEGEAFNKQELFFSIFYPSHVKVENLDFETAVNAVCHYIPQGEQITRKILLNKIKKENPYLRTLLSPLADLNSYKIKQKKNNFTI